MSARGLVGTGGSTVPAVVLSSTMPAVVLGSTVPASDLGSGP